MCRELDFDVFCLLRQNCIARKEYDSQMHTKVQPLHLLICAQLDVFLSFVNIKPLVQSECLDIWGQLGALTRDLSPMSVFFFFCVCV